MSADPGGFEFQVVSPHRVVLRERVTSLIVPGIGGAVGFWVDHAPMLVALAPGVVKYRPLTATDQRVEFRSLAVGGGLFEVSAEGETTLLADTAELPEEIDVERAKAALKRAKRRLLGPTPDLDMIRAEAALKRALARLRVVTQP